MYLFKKKNLLIFSIEFNFLPFINHIPLAYQGLFRFFYSAWIY